MNITSLNSTQKAYSSKINELEKEQKASWDNKTTITKDSKSSSDIKAEIEVLKKQLEINNKKIENFERRIELTANKAQDNILEAAKEQEQAVKDHEEESKKVLNENISAFIKANKENGKGMTKEQLQTNIEKSLPDNSAIAKALAKLVSASEEINELDVLLGSLKGLILETNSLQSGIESKEADYQNALSAEEEAKKCCDPIGFVVDNIRYDFIVDDGKFDSTSDFLGAKNQWAQMEDLDTDKSGVVNRQELEKGNIKLIKTDANGKQSIVDIKKEFGDNFSIDLSTYSKGGVHSSIDTTKDFDNDGVVDQKLLGTFSVNINGKNIKGYNTLDDIDYLEKEYGIEKTTDSINDNFFNQYSEKSNELKASLNENLNAIGLSEQNIEGITKTTLISAKQKANLFIEQMEKEQKAKEAKELEAKELEAKEKEEQEKEEEKEEEKK